MNNLTPTSPMESRRLWTAGVWECRETMLKNNTDVMYISRSLSLVKGYCLHFFIYLYTFNQDNLECSSSRSFLLIPAPYNTGPHVLFSTQLKHIQSVPSLTRNMVCVYILFWRNSPPPNPQWARAPHSQGF